MEHLTVLQITLKTILYFITKLYTESTVHSVREEMIEQLMTSQLTRTAGKRPHS
jgi:hypothetical protein